MKANSRRRVLISSVAMLLVALVALSTATYAWFTQSTEAYADGIHVRTTKVSELEISSKNVDWTTHVAYNAGTADANKLIMPASTANGEDWYSANADANTSYYASTASKITDAPTDSTNTTNYYFADQLNIRNYGQATCKGVTIQVTGFSGNYARLAIVPVTEKGGTTIAETGKTFADYIYDVDGVAYEAATGTDLTKNTQTVTPKTTTTVTVGDIEAGDVVYYNVYVWFEGQDVHCENRNSGQKIPGIKLTVSGTSEADAA